MPRAGAEGPAVEQRQHGAGRRAVDAAAAPSIRGAAARSGAARFVPDGGGAMTDPRHDAAVPLLYDYLIDTARRLPEKIALVSKQARLTYAEIDRRSNALAHALCARGVARGDRVI